MTNERGDRGKIGPRSIDRTKLQAPLNDSVETRCSNTKDAAEDSKIEPSITRIGLYPRSSDSSSSV